MIRKPRNISRHEWTTALHEAAHAVVAFFLNRKFKLVTVIPCEKTWGHIELHVLRNFNPDYDSNWRIRRMIENSMAISLAGLVVEQKLLKDKHNMRDSRAGGDMRNAISLAEYINGDNKGVELYVEWILHCTKRLLTFPLNWKAVKVLAIELINKKTIKGKEAREIIRKALIE